MSKWFFLFAIFTVSMTGPSILGAPLSLIASLVAVVVFMLTALVKKYPFRRVFKFNVWWVCAGLIVLGGMFSSFNAVNVTDHIIEIFQALWILVVLLSVVPFCVRLWPVPCLWAFLIGAALNSSIAVFDYFNHTNLSRVLNETSITFTKAYVPFSLVSAQSFNDRYTAFMHHPNALGEFSAASFAISLGMFWHAVSNKKIILAGLSLFFVVLHGVANYASGSFSGLLGLVLAFVLIFLCLFVPRLSRSPVNIFMGFLVVVFLGVMVFFFGTFSLETFQERILVAYNRVTETSGPFRMQLMADALDLITHSPLIGYGMDMDSRRTIFGDNSVHNAFLLAWVTGGFFAFAGTILAYFFEFKLAVGHLWAAFRGRAGWLQISLAAAIFANMFITMFQPESFSFHIWVFVAFLMAYSSPLIASKTRNGIFDADFIPN